MDRPHNWQFPNALDDQRRVWTRSFLIALSVHLGIGAWLLSHVMPDPPTDVMPRVEPMLRAAIAREPVGMSGSGAASVDAAEPAAVNTVEPSLNDIRGGMEHALNSAVAAPDSADAINRLSNQARLLEQVSNPREVARMTHKISKAMGLQAWPEGATSRPAQATPFDFDKALLLDITREEQGDRVTIREVMGTRDGARAVIESSRRITDTGSRYEQRLIEPGVAVSDATPMLSMDAEDFAAVESRQKPYELIRQYPLVQQLHRAAVLPLIEKLANESSVAGEPAP